MTNLLPIAAIIAIILFLLREFFDGWRRYNARDRKRRATKVLLANELERNKWALRNLRGHLSTLSDVVQNKSEILFEVDINGNITIGTKIGEIEESTSPLSQIHHNILTDNLKEIAENDDEMFKAALNAYHAVNELKHVQDSLLKYVLDLFNNKDSFRLSFVEGFIDYAVLVSNRKLIE